MATEPMQKMALNELSNLVYPYLAMHASLQSFHVVLSWHSCLLSVQTVAVQFLPQSKHFRAIATSPGYASKQASQDRLVTSDAMAQ